MSIRHGCLGPWLLAVAASASLGSMGLASEPIRFVPPKPTEKPLRPNFTPEKSWSRDELISESLKAPASPSPAGESSAAAGETTISRKERTTSVAGEPIRFVRARFDEKPLRYNFAAEKIRSREGISAASFQPSSGGAAMSSGGIAINRKARAAALARRNWASSEKSDSDARSAQLAEDSLAVAESAESLDLDPTKSRKDSSVFSGELGLSPRGFGSSQPGSVAEDRNQGLGNRFGADNRAALRGLLGESWGSSGAGNAGSLGNGTRGNVSAGFGSPGGFQGSLSPAGGEPRRDGADSSLGGSAFAPRPGANAGFGGPAANPPPEPRKPTFDPSDRPLRSNFELPTRPR